MDANANDLQEANDGESSVSDGSDDDFDEDSDPSDGESIADHDSDQSDMSGSDSDSTDTDSDDGVPNVAGIWTTILGADVPPAEFPFTANAGPIHAPMASARPIEYVKMFFTMHFMNAIATQTNLYAQQWVDSHANFLRVHTRSRVHQWIKLGGTSADELYAFLAIIVNMGLNRKPNIEAYWESSRSSQKMPWFPEHMSRDRFTILLTMQGHLVLMSRT